ncbi:ATP-binding protein [Rhodoflexus caldus]|uniref:ATP-binding protein n=1 Tax=Rhodoflexus caldus TaxID=2891236 RepID=UPI002029E3A8|nr:ATP-binding protein [Rhodoflexus caldus]
MLLLRLLPFIFCFLGLWPLAAAQQEILLHGKVVFDDGRPAVNIEFQVDNLRPFTTDRKGQFGSMIPASFNSPKQVRVNNDKLSVVNWFYDTEQQLLQITLRASQQNLVGRVITRTGDPINNANVAVIVQGTEVGSGISDENGYFAFFIPADIKLSPQATVKVNQSVLSTDDVKISLNDRNNYFLHLYYKQPANAELYAVVVYDHQKRLQNEARVIYNRQEFAADSKGVIYVPLSGLQDMPKLKVAGGVVTARNFSTPLKRISLYTAPAAPAKAATDTGQAYMRYFDEITRSLEGNRAEIEKYNTLITHEMEKLTKRFSADNNIHPEEARRYLARMEILEQLLLKNHSLMTAGNEQTRSALMRLKDAIAARDSLSQITHQQIAELADKNAELDRANKRIESDTQFKLMIAAGLITAFVGMSLAIGYLYKRTVRQKEQLEVTNTELRTTLAALKKTQAQLVQQDRMTSLGQMAAGIAHEINNPINFIYAGADSLRRNFIDLKQLLTIYRNPALHNGSKQSAIEQWEKVHNADMLLNESEELVASLKRGATRTFEIVQGLRSFARIDEENLIKLTNIEESLDNVLMLLSGQFASRIQIEKYYGNIPKIECYPARLNQVFLNLLINAIESIDNQGIIFITTTYPAKGRHVPSDMKDAVAITIADTGRGISQKHLPHIFDPFFTTKEVGDGVGLGLSIALGIVKEHGGNIVANSREGKGSQFLIILPRQLAHT